MRITKWGEYGILCCIELVGNDGSTTVQGASSIAKSVGIPQDYAQQILQRLRKAGVISSVRGPRGGYTLTKAPKDTTLKDILYAAEGATFEVLCDGNGIYESCSEQSHGCGLQSIWRELQVSIDELLEKKNLADLAAQHDFTAPEEQLVAIAGSLRDST